MLWFYLKGKIRINCKLFIVQNFYSWFEVCLLFGLILPFVFLVCSGFDFVFLICKKLCGRCCINIFRCGVIIGFVLLRYEIWFDIMAEIYLFFVIILRKEPILKLLKFWIIGINIEKSGVFVVKTGVKFV